jgi:predicted GIY-YIG superfamily endonuclease
MTVGYTYILECADGSFYTGSTKNLEKRLWEHDNFLGANYTKKKHPAKLVYYEKYPRIDEAFYREKQIQGWSRKKKKAMIDGENNQLKQLAECQNESHYLRYGSVAFDASTSLSNQSQAPEKKAPVSNRSLSVVETTTSKEQANAQT